MAIYELRMPKMGESVFEATVLNWLKEVDDQISGEETILEVATDKVDTDIPSPVSGVLKEILISEGQVAKVGQALALIETTDESNGTAAFGELVSQSKKEKKGIKNASKQKKVKKESKEPPKSIADGQTADASLDEVILSPLVRNIAKKEGIALEELRSIRGSGQNGRVTKDDVMAHLSRRGKGENIDLAEFRTVEIGGQDRVVELDRMQRLISAHMVESKRTSPHVTSFVEADVTEAVLWRQKNKDLFTKKYGTKLTFTPILIEAIVKAIQKYPQINSTLDGDRWIIKSRINIGMAAALPDGNLIVPVIKDANRLNLIGLAERVNQLSANARNNALSPEDINGGTFTMSNVGTFGNITGTPIINQPQLAILAAGVAKKKPAVIETDYGDLIAVRHMMILSMSYDHRVINGYLGGSFLKEVADQLEAFDSSREI